MERSLRGVLLTGLLNLLSCITQDYQPRAGTTRKGLGSPMLISKKIPYRHTHKQSGGGKPPIQLPLPRRLSLCLVDKKLTCASPK